MLTSVRQAAVGNPVLFLAVVAWFIAQVLKVVINLTVQNELNLRLLISSGGMPSSHSALVCSCAATIGRLDGLHSTTFALAAVLSLVVMYDACNVRRAAGEQAKILNRIVDHWEELFPAMVGKDLKELLGHTPLQVFVGALLGAIVGWFGVQLF